MKALFFVGDGQMELREIPIPVPRSDEYLIHIDACGICGSDVEGYLGKTGRRTAPMIMGHECAGTVTQAPQGGAYRAGETVAVFPKYFCGQCEACTSGKANLCTHGAFIGALSSNGAMTEYICVREPYLLPYTGIGADVASLAEPAAVAYSGVSKCSVDMLKRAENILVVGAGTIGLMVLLWLKYRGAKRVLVSDASDARLALAKRMGADATINPLREDFLSTIKAHTAGKLCELSIEAVGLDATAQASLEALAPAGHALWIGNAAPTVSVPMQRIVTTELTILGSYIYSLQDFQTCVRLLAEKAVDPTPLLTHHMPLEEGVEAFRLLSHGNQDGAAVKVVLVNP